jgi:hypothetical protein
MKMRSSKMLEKKLVCFLVLLLTFSASSMAFAGIPPLETAKFPVGTYVIPMDEKQDALAPGDVTVFGFIWGILNDGADIYRIIEPPDITLKTTTNPDGTVYSGGVILVMEVYGSIITAQQANFTTVVVDTLTEPFTSNKVLFVDEPTNIVVIYGSYGHTEITLDWMRIPYTLVYKSDVEANASMLLDYDLVIDDCPGWDGYVPEAVVTNMTKLTSNGGQIVFTCIALLDLAQVFPGYVSFVTNLAWTGNVTIHNPPLTGFPAEYSSQYPATFPSTVKIHTEPGGYIVDNVLNSSVVRVIMDSSDYYGTYRILACYFPYGDGIVEYFTYHPQEQTEGTTGDPNSYVTSALLYGSKFVTGIPALGAIWSSDDLGNEKNTFDLSETVYVAMSATGETIRVYAVADQTTWTNGGPLADVSGDGYEELNLTIDGTQVVKLWDPPLTGGDYDIVVDRNRNGVYDEGIDVVDSFTLVGFDVIPEFPSFLIMPLFIVLPMLAVVFAKKKAARRLKT